MLRILRRLPIEGEIASRVVFRGNHVVRCAVRRLTTHAISGVVLALVISGCGTTRWTDSPRAATEELLLTDAVDRSVEQIDFSPLCGRRVFLDTQYIATRNETGYLISSLRQHLAASGCRLSGSAGDAELVVEARVGSQSTNRHDALLGIPATAVPPVFTGVPVAIPELAISKKTIQTGISKLAVFAYWTTDGAIAWQSGVARHDSLIQNRWLLGLGPYTEGASTVRGREPGVAPEVPLLSDIARINEDHLSEPPPSTLAVPTVYDVSRPIAPRLPLPLPAVPLAAPPAEILAD
jgi:hypothetical protein